MTTKTRKPKPATGRRSLDRLVSPQALDTSRRLLRDSKLKLRRGGKLIINTKTFKVTNVPIIECWHPPQRRYLPLTIGDRWRYDTEEDRDAVLAALNEG